MLAWRQLLSDHTDTGQALNSLTPEQAFRYPYLSNPMMVAVVSDVPQVGWLEEGRAGFHLPSRWGGHWKVSAQGHLYATVPFRQSTPPTAGGGVSTSRGRLGNAMSPQVYRLAKTLGDYRTTRERLGGFGDLYKRGVSYDLYRSGYGWDLPANLDNEQGYEWKSSQFEGMFRNTVKTPGGGSHTEYVTMRTITPDSPGWYIPPMPALHLAAHALDQALPAIREVIDRAVQRDLESAVMVALGGQVFVPGASV